MLWAATIRGGNELGKVDWRGAMVADGVSLFLPARDEECGRERVRLLTERAFRFPLEPTFMIAMNGRKFRWRKELPSMFNYLVTAWLVSRERNRDEARAVVWEGMDGGQGLVRVASVKDGIGGYCQVEVGVVARCEEQAEVMVRERLQEACCVHGLEFVPIDAEDELWIERRESARFFG